MVSISACHAEDTGSNPVTCSRANLARLSMMRNPLSLLKLGVYSKPNLVSKKDFKFFLSRFESCKIMRLEVLMMKPASE